MCEYHLKSSQVPGVASLEHSDWHTCLKPLCWLSKSPRKAPWGHEHVGLLDISAEMGKRAMASALHRRSFLVASPTKEYSNDCGACQGITSKSAHIEVPSSLWSLQVLQTPQNHRDLTKDSGPILPGTNQFPCSSRPPSHSETDRVAELQALLIDPVKDPSRSGARLNESASHR